MSVIKKNLKKYDVFIARWKKREWGDQKDHCFEGLFIVEKYGKKDFRFVDNYWGRSGTTANKVYNFTRALELFNLKYYCNLKDLIGIGQSEVFYYKDEDIFCIHEQHGCSKSYYIKRGTKKNKEKIITVLKNKIEKSKHNIDWEIKNIEDWSKKIQKAKKDDFEFYI